MNDKLATLLINQDDETTHPEIIREDAHFLFGDSKSTRRKGKYKYDHDEFKMAFRAGAV
jgi:hypothetical protein